MLPRLLEARLKRLLSLFPVVFLAGPQQAGKTTLSRKVAQERGMAYHTLDDPTELAAARTDPQGYVANLPLPSVLDEVQRAPELFLPLKARVDREGRPGAFLLTGSANVLLLPQVADALVGRMAVARLLPLAQAEIEGGKGRFPDLLLALAQGQPLPPAPPLGDLRARVGRGGFPPAVLGQDPKEWFRAYLDTLLSRDVRELAQIERLQQLPHLLAVLASRQGGLLNAAELSREVGIPYPTLRRYLRLLEALYLVVELPPWSGNLGKRLLKAPKVYLNDTGLAAHLLGHPGVPLEGGQWGHLLEAFAAGEILRLQAVREDFQPYHYREAGGLEADFLLEFPQGLVALEVKAKATLGARDFVPLTRLRDRLGKRLLLAGILHPGERPLPFGEGVWALPLSYLWA
ncbi:ATP-binding protein [Thermus sp.]|uniref:ATP-binding protein n=1 Tax=Thermus sp. TaxID=275 RepID=UPI0025F45664|nr:ATP-binding protein [Thermus sp.]